MHVLQRVYFVNKYILRGLIQESFKGRERDSKKSKTNSFQREGPWGLFSQPPPIFHTWDTEGYKESHTGNNVPKSKRLGPQNSTGDKWPMGSAIRKASWKRVQEPPFEWKSKVPSQPTHSRAEEPLFIKPLTLGSPRVMTWANTPTETI